ncbi:MAG: DUF488 family protein [Thermodesulfovibrionia bacterium]|nr:DUF488 family protein [Thermodesulfovibrionia bacterium]
MIYTIGYQKSNLKHIISIMDAKDIGLLVDVRSVPYSRVPEKYEFNKNRMIEELKDKYLWVGDICGGKSGNPVPQKCINEIIDLHKGRGFNLLLMCMENHPCDCHRLYDISRRLVKSGEIPVHLFDGNEVETHVLSERFCKERGDNRRGKR